MTREEYVERCKVVTQEAPYYSTGVLCVPNTTQHKMIAWLEDMGWLGMFTPHKYPGSRGEGLGIEHSTPLSYWPAHFNNTLKDSLEVMMRPQLHSREISIIASRREHFENGNYKIDNRFFSCSSDDVVTLEFFLRRLPVEWP